MAKKDTAHRRVLNIVPSKGVEKDWTFDTAVKAGVTARAASLPPKVDLREPWHKVANQGDTGSCVGWASADSVLRWHLVKNNKLPKTQPLSVRFVWMSSKETDEFRSRPSSFIEESGTSLKAALDVLRKFGCLLDTDLPFKSGKLYTGTEDDLYAKASRFKIQSYYNLISQNKIQNWKNWLANHGPIFTCLDVDKNWYDVKKDGKLNRYDAKSAEGGHAVAIVGYTSDRFIVRNSWGESWGDKGYAYASLDYADAAFYEAYGIMI